MGYVGLPLAVEVGKQYETIGFDIDAGRITYLQRGNDKTLEVSEAEIALAKMLKFSDNERDLRDANFYIVTVPTPVDKHNKPDLSLVERATKMVAGVLDKGDIVIYESTVYPGVTEEVCVPILEKFSQLKFNKDFYCGYSPERINPGDKTHRLSDIKKVTSGSTPEIGHKIDEFYSSIIPAGTFLASSIKVAEAAKVIENAQRDINIAFVNELSIIFERIGIDTLEVLKAAGTKWNFLNFSPGLVGGHCIGVDPYYLTHKAEEVGYKSRVILSGRSVNDEMGSYVASRVMKLLASKKLLKSDLKILILGITFKENCPDIRNTRVIDIEKEFTEYGFDVDVYDPHADPDEVSREYGIELINSLTIAKYEAIVAAVAHREFQNLDWENLDLNNKVVFDVKGTLPNDVVTSRL